MRRCSGFAFTEITAGNLDIAIVRKLAATKFPLGDQFEPSPMKVVGFEAAFRRGGLWKEGLEHAPRHANDAFIVAHPDAEFDGRALRVPPGVGRKAEEHEIPPMEATENVRVKFSDSVAKGKGVVEPFVATGRRRHRDYRFWIKPKYARALATRTPNQLTQNGMLKPPISTDHPKMIRSRCIIATPRNSVAVTVI
jgi:hypothetical protein